MSVELYHRSTCEDGALRPGSRQVLANGEGRALFRCPCGEHQIYVTSPPHTIAFTDAGLLILSPSVGFVGATFQPPAPWCHFFIGQKEPGVPEMCGDAQCPGACA